MRQASQKAYGRGGLAARVRHRARWKHAAPCIRMSCGREPRPISCRDVAAAERRCASCTPAPVTLQLPAHIYARVGRFHDAVIANQKAIAADDWLPCDLPAGARRLSARLRAAQSPISCGLPDRGRREHDRPRCPATCGPSARRNAELMRRAGPRVHQNLLCRRCLSTFARALGGVVEAQSQPTIFRTCRPSGTTPGHRSRLARAGIEDAKKFHEALVRRRPTRKSRSCCISVAIR